MDLNGDGEIDSTEMMYAEEMLWPKNMQSIIWK